ncbi:unnamed protein product, partial [Rotaria socialis]
MPDWWFKYAYYVYEMVYLRIT